MVQAKDVRKVLARHMLADGMEPVIDLEKSQGSWMVDKRNGDRYLDFFSMFASMAVGYNHPKLVAKQEELGRLAIHKPTNSDVYSEELADFLEIFSRIGIPKELPHAFFIEGGGLAVENALKTAFDWKVRKNFEKGYKEPKGYKVIHFQQCFHGRTGYTLSMTNTHDPRKTQYFPKFDWPRVLNPKIIFPLNEDNLEKVKKAESESLKQIHQAIEKYPDEIAALILEPVQGEGGDNHFRPEFVRELRKICDDHEILLIFDEVQTGVGLTGKFWAYEHYGIKPDIISFGKKSQVCGILAGTRIDEVKNNVFAESSRINSTWGGNLVDMVRFGYILRIIEEENLVENARIQGAFLLGELEKIVDDFPGLVSNARGKGLMCAFDLKDEKTRNVFLGELEKEKVLMLGCGEKSVRFRPHLNVSQDEILHGIEKIRLSLKKLT
ncbi:MAG: L-lysine 6-transaminase [Fidelibacterota bacterium]